jgi:hypothetical protein
VTTRIPDSASPSLGTRRLGSNRDVVIVTRAHAPPRAALTQMQQAFRVDMDGAFGGRMRTRCWPRLPRLACDAFAAWADRQHKTGSAGSIAAVIGGKHLCLKAGQTCKAKLERQYRRYRFHCQNGRLTRVPKPSSVYSAKVDVGGYRLAIRCQGGGSPTSSSKAASTVRGPRGRSYNPRWQASRASAHTTVPGSATAILGSLRGPYLPHASSKSSTRC